MSVTNSMKLPWHWREHLRDSDYADSNGFRRAMQRAFYIGGSGGASDFVADIFLSRDGEATTPRGPTPHDAIEFIVAARNAHCELLKACKDADRFLMTLFNPTNSLRSQIRYALKIAKDRT